MPLFVLLAAVALAGSAGCRAPKAADFKPSNIFSMKSSWPFRDKDEPLKGTPVRIVGTWTDTVLSQPGKHPQRGFGGRLMFYGTDSDKPILVDGQLVVYAFDETGREPTDNKPTRRYVFPPDQIPLHMSESEIGASYSFWLPWDEAGGERTEVSLICRFEPTAGAVVTSEQTRHLLPGAIGSNTASAGKLPRLPEGVASRPARPSLDELRKLAQTEGAQLASYESAAAPPNAALQPAPAAAASAPGPRMSVTSIRLPENYRLPAAAATTTITVPATPRPALPRPQPQATAPQPAAPNATATAPANPTPATLQPTLGIGTIHLPRPQIATPQVMTLQPSAAPTRGTGTAPTLSYPAAAAQPAAR